VTVLTSAVEAAVLVIMDRYKQLRQMPGAASTLSHKMAPAVCSAFMQLQSESGHGYCIDLAAVAAARKHLSGGTADAASNPFLDGVLTKVIKETVATGLDLLDPALEASTDIAKYLLVQVLGAIEYANLLLAAHDKTAAVHITKAILRAVKQTDQFWLANRVEVKEDIKRTSAAALRAVDPKYESSNIGTAATISMSVTTLVKFQRQPCSLSNCKNRIAVFV
jgi:hypothetical protein